MQLIAHRGIWNKKVKDNSYEALKNGLLSNEYIGIECDIRTTLDKKFIIYHNTLYKGNLVRNTNYKDMKDILLLEDLLKIKTDKILLLEIKEREIDKNKLLKLLNKYKPNIFLGGPILFNEMVDSGIIKDTSFITSPISGGDKLAVAEEERANNYIKEHGGTAVIHQGYGESECTAAATYAKTNAYALGSIGIPFINVLVSIFDEDYNEIPFGEGKIGEICISGPTVMDGYYKDKKETEDVLKKHKDGRIWLHTKDYGYMDNDGRIYHCGRAKRMITRHGDKVWLTAIEEIIKTHHNVYDCCTVKGNDAVEREVPVCYIVFNDDSKMVETIKELDEMIKAKLKELYIPKYYVKTDEIPLTEVNKKVDFVKLEKIDIFDKDIYQMNGNLIEPKRSKTKIKTY